MCLLLNVKHGFIPKNVVVQACVRNVCNANVSRVVIEVLRADNTAVYSTPEDTRTWTPGNELCINFSVPSSVQSGVYWLRASGEDANGNVVISNIILVYIDDYDDTGISGDYVSAIRFVDADIDDYGSGNLYAPRNSDLFITEVDGQGYYRTSSGSVEKALVVSREYVLTFSNYDRMLDYVRQLSPIDPFADINAIDKDKAVDVLLPMFSYSQMRKTGRLICYRDGLDIVCKELYSIRQRLIGWTYGGGGGGGAAIAVGILLGAFVWWEHRQTRNEIISVVKETGKQIIDNDAKIANKLSQQIEDTAVTIVESTNSTIWAIPKDILIKKLRMIGAMTRADITRIANMHKANIDALGPEKEIDWKYVALGAIGGFIIGALVAKR